MTTKTHRMASRPSISARHLADYMDASESAKRTIIRDCKYHRIARVLQHDEAKSAISHFYVTGAQPAALVARSRQLKERMADDDFERDKLDVNADYIDRFTVVFSEVKLPVAEIEAPGPTQRWDHSGVRVSMELQWRLRRTVRNQLRTGGTMLRYAKGKPLNKEVGLWQAALLFGVLEETAINDNESPDRNLCTVLDAYTGICYSAPGDSRRRFLNMKAALETISERWPNIQPPAKAVI